MYLFGRKNTILVIGGMVFYHSLVGVLCMFFIYKFLMISYDVGVLLLLSLLIGPMIICDILAGKMQVFGRFLIRCRTDSEGIHCIYFRKRWSIKWSDIHIFGVTGFSSVAQTGVVFLSSDLREKYQQNRLTLVTSKRIAFSYEEQRWDKLSTYMPDDIKKKLQQAITSTRDCYYRR